MLILGNYMEKKFDEIWGVASFCYKEKIWDLTYRKAELSETEPNSRIFTVKTILNEDISKTKLLKRVETPNNLDYEFYQIVFFCEIRWSKEAERLKFELWLSLRKCGFTVFYNLLLNCIKVYFFWNCQIFLEFDSNS